MSHTFCITGECSIYQATELAQALKTWMSEACAHGAAALDLSQVTEIDSAGLQLLLSTQRSAQALGLPFYVQADSPAVQEALHLTALSHLLHPEIQAL